MTVNTAHLNPSEIKRRSEELEALQEISLAINAQLELDELLQNIVERGCRLLNIGTGGVYLVDQKRGDLELVVSHGHTRDYTGARLAPGEGLAGKVLQSGEPLAVDDYSQWEGQSLDWEAEPLTAALGVPLKYGDRIVGVLDFAEIARARSIDEHDIWLAGLFANQAAIVIENVRLYQDQQRQLQDILLLHEISTRVGSSLDPQEVLNHIVLGAIEAVGADAASINLLIAPGEAQMMASVGLSQRFQQRSDVRPDGTTMTVIRTGKPLLIPDTTQQPDLAKPVMLEEGIQSLIVLPLPGQDRVIGAMYVVCHRVHRFSDDDVRLLTILANQAAVAIENARLFSSLAQEKERLGLLYRLGQHLSESLDIHEVAQRALDEICTVTGAVRGVAVVVEPDSDRLRLVAVSGYDAESVEDLDQRLNLKLGNGLAGWVAAQRQPSLVDDVTRNERWMPLSGLDDWVRSALSVPLLSGDELVGVFSIYSDQEAFFNDDHRRLVESAAATVSVAIANARLYEQAQQEIADRKQAQQETLASNRLLEEALAELHGAQERILAGERLAAVGQMAAGIAHDFNNILGAILLISQLLLKGEKYTPEDRERLNTIREQARRGASLISQILDFSRRSIMEKQPIDLSPFLGEVEKLLSRTLPENIKLKFTFSEEETYVVNADPTRLEQVFMNLSFNARDAMPEGGILQFSLSRLQVELGKPPFRDMAPGAWVRVRVSDTGVGIPQAILPRIFEPFFTAKEAGKGTGLGLAQVYGIIKNHNGYIDVASEVEKGTTFMIYLPALEGDAVPQAVQDTVEGDEQGGGETILVVEDDEAIRQALAEILEALNYRILPASDGQEALTIFERQGKEIDLVLTDRVMPNMSGLELNKKLRELRPEVRMILMTGYPIGPETRELVEAGSIGWIQKPLDVETLARRIRKVIDQDNPQV